MRNHSRRKACWKHTSKVCPNPQKQMSFRGMTVPPIITRLFLLRAISGESSQAFWSLPRAVVPQHAPCMSAPQPPVCLSSVHQSVPSLLSPGSSQPHWGGKMGLSPFKAVCPDPAHPILELKHILCFWTTHPEEESWLISNHTSGLRQMVPYRMIYTV